MGHTVHTIKDTGFFLPSYTERAKGILSYLFNKQATKPNDNIPEGMSVEELYVSDGDVTYKCCHYEAPNAKHALFVLGGLRSSGKGKHEIFDVARRAGISVIFAELPVGEDEDADLAKIEKMSVSFLTNTPYYDQYKHISRYLMGHSTGGTCITFALHNEELAKPVLDKFDCIKPLGACYKPSYKASTWQHVIYPFHANRNRDVEYGDCLGDKLHIVWNIARGNPFTPAAKDSPYPRHREVINFGDALEKRSDELFKKPFPDCVRKSKKIEFLHGSLDNVSDPDSAREVARRMNARFTMMENTFHNPYTPERIGAILYHIFNPANAVKHVRHTQARSMEAFRLRLPLTFRMRQPVVETAHKLPVPVNQ